MMIIKKLKNMCQRILQRSIHSKYFSFLTINSFIIFAIFLGPMGLLIELEKPNPGREGTMTSKPSSFFQPNFSGCVSLGIKLKNSTILPGQPCNNNKAFDFGLLLFSLMK